VAQWIEGVAVIVTILIVILFDVAQTIGFDIKCDESPA
jgi:hypothetical protein